MSESMPAFRRAYRDTQQPVLGGVAAGLARHVGLPVLWVRAGFVLLAVLGGAGLVLYGALWFFVPAAPAYVEQAPGLASATRTGKRPGRVRRLGDAGPAIALGALAIGLALLANAVLGTGGIWLPIGLGVAGVALLWRQADEAQRERWLDSTGRVDPFRTIFGAGGWPAYARVAAGLTLVGGSLVVFAFRSGNLNVAWDLVVAGLAGTLGLAIVIGPWITRLASDLTAERAERVRTQERADMAAHLHDSVLQTLALIQKNAADAPMVARLARSQERDLRSWLYDVAPSGGATVATALRSIGAAVEDDHGVTVDLVAVGDCALDEALEPVVAATREAMTNAAKHAGTGRVDVYVEVTAEAVEVFVRDRGTGFALDDVPADRYGVRHSILDRMERHGGTAEVRTSRGNGTEVRLRLPRTQVTDDTSREGKTDE